MASSAWNALDDVSVSLALGQVRVPEMVKEWQQRSRVVE